MTSIFVIVGYMVMVTVIGAVLSRRTASSKDWAVAGGGMGMLMVAVGVAGTRIGGAGTYGVAGNVISGGVWNMWWYGITTFLAMAIVGSAGAAGFGTWFLIEFFSGDGSEGADPADPSSPESGGGDGGTEDDEEGLDTLDDLLWREA